MSNEWPAFEVVPVKFYFFRRQHAAEFVAELHRLEIFDAKFGQTFSGGRERWMVTTDWQVLWHGPVLAHWFQEAHERWKPSAEAKTEDKLT